MKLLRVFSLLLVSVVAYTSAQSCVGNPFKGNPSCTGERNVGRSGRGCNARTMWYFDGRTRQCREMRYLGCGGNRNLWCNRVACERRCRRRPG